MYWLRLCEKVPNVHRTIVQWTRYYSVKHSVVQRRFKSKQRQVSEREVKIKIPMYVCNSSPFRFLLLTCNMQMPSELYRNTHKPACRNNIMYLYSHNHKWWQCSLTHIHSFITACDISLSLSTGVTPSHVRCLHINQSLIELHRISRPHCSINSSSCVVSIIVSLWMLMFCDTHLFVNNYCQQ